jgi:hypothetical protein
MAGSTDFNSELCSAELQVLDDEIASQSIHERRKLAAHVKQFTVGFGVSFHKKTNDAITLYPRWRVAFALNDTAHDLAVLPPLERGIKDKLILLKTVQQAVPTDSVETFTAYVKSIKEELPGVVAKLLAYTIPPDICHPRYMVASYCNPDVEMMLSAIAPHAKLAQLTPQVYQ